MYLIPATSGHKPERNLFAGPEKGSFVRKAILCITCHGKCQINVCYNRSIVAPTINIKAKLKINIINHNFTN